jgi:hypothetical protein
MWPTFQMIILCIFWPRGEFCYENFDQELATLHNRQNKSFSPAIANIHSDPV